jgi:hypothetical protein
MMNIHYKQTTGNAKTVPEIKQQPTVTIYTRIILINFICILQ